MNRKALVLSVLMTVVCGQAFATNGMNMEGYGPIATGMGGASMAIDNGAASFANNPATIGLIGRDGALLDLAVGILSPDVNAEMTVDGMGTMSASSAADMFMMPGFGYLMPKGKLTWGVAVFAQGGMGTEYAADSFMAAGTSEDVMSQVGIGRFGIPVSYEATDKLIVGGSMDFVWASMDLKMAMGGMQFGDFVAEMGGTQTFGAASGSMVDGLLGAVSAGMLNPMGPVNWARFDFADDSDFTGKAMGTGLAVKLGAVYKVNDQLTLGGTFHSETSLGDLNTDDATVTMSANYDDAILGQTWDPMNGVGAPAGTYSPVSVPVTGEIDVIDFQWPSMLGVGAGYQLNDKLMLAVDIKQIMWSKVMADFKMSFTADAAQDNPMAMGFAGAEMDMNLIQEWDDQTVIALGAAYDVNDQFTVRGGVNLSSNPVPDDYLNALFPAIIENHFTFGLGYKINEANMVNLSTTIAPEVEATAGSGVTSTHSQFNMQLMFTHTF
jgi:long-chain fatty acid transport protein